MQSACTVVMTGIIITIILYTNYNTLLHNNYVMERSEHRCMEQMSYELKAVGVLCCFALFVCLALLASFFLPSHLSLKTCIYSVNLAFGVIGGFITPAFSFILS